jgi:hypothetical protein
LTSPKKAPALVIVVAHRGVSGREYDQDHAERNEPERNSAIAG